MQNNLLIVDDERDVAKAIKRTLRLDKYQIFTAENGKEALEILCDNDIQVILTDQRMPERVITEFCVRGRIGVLSGA